MRLQGKRVLVVEDEYMIAADLKRALHREGADVVGPVSQVGAALRLVNNGRIDAAILDLNLEGEFSYPVAERLDQEAVPYMLVTGYDSWAIPPALKDRPTFPKPYSTPVLIEAVCGLCKEGRSS